MAALSTIALVGGLALSAAGTATQMMGAKDLAEASNRGTDAQVKAEGLREQAMHLDADRKRREMVRAGIVARGQALSQATGQGAQYGSGIQGAMGAITEQTNYNQLGTSQNEQISSGLFGANRELLAARRSETSAQTLNSIGGGLSTLGGSLAKNTEGINRLAGWGSTFFKGTP